ncbi:hypothetical protein KXD40_009104 [Peronospora effusa]|nr:hypothetical protein KXD40_009104 [Peronospora effusa]
MIVYADDADFICQSADIATLIETEAPAVLAKWSLQMKTSKTEHTIVHRSITALSNRITRAKDEDWRITRKLVLSSETPKTSPVEFSGCCTTPHVESLAPAIEDLGSYVTAPLQLLRLADPAL